MLLRKIFYIGKFKLGFLRRKGFWMVLWGAFVSYLGFTPIFGNDDSDRKLVITSIKNMVELDIDLDQVEFAGYSLFRQVWFVHKKTETSKEDGESDSNS